MKLYENGSNWVIEDQLNEKLVEKINNLIDKNLNSLLKFKERCSTTGKNVEQYWLVKLNSNFYFKNKDFEDIKKEYKDNVLNRLKKSNLLNEKNIDLIPYNTWSVIGEENSFHTIHSHNNIGSNGISTILYLNVPESNVETSPENNLFLIMNSDPNIRFYNSIPRSVEINPKIGKLLIFPNWIIHGTYPQTKGIRQTFNTEYKFTFEEKTKKKLEYN